MYDEKLKKACAKRKAERLSEKENTKKAALKPVEPNKDLKKGRCIYYTRDVSQHGLCGKSINVRLLVGGHDFGWLNKTPCFKEHKTSIKCSLFKI